MSVVDGVNINSNASQTAYRESSGTRRLSSQPQPSSSEPSAESRSEAVGADANPPVESTENRDSIERIVDDVNESLKLSSRSVRFKIHEDTKQIQIQVVDAEKGKVIRSIPSDEMIRLASRLREFAGLGAMVDTSR